MKILFVVVFVFFQSLVYCQGTVLDQGDSGAILGYGSSDLGKKRLHSLFYGYSIKRKIDIGLEAGLVGDNKLVGMSLSGYTNSRSPIDFRISLLLAKIIGDDFDWEKAVNVTVFYLNSEPNSSFSPHAGFTFAGVEEVFNFGFDFKLGGSNSGIVLGLDYVVPSESTNYFSFSLGILFVDRNRSKSEIKSSPSI